MKLLSCELVRSILGRKIFGNQKHSQKIAKEKEELELESKVIGEVTLVPQEFLTNSSNNKEINHLKE